MTADVMVYDDSSGSLDLQVCETRARPLRYCRAINTKNKKMEDVLRSRESRPKYIQKPFQVGVVERHIYANPP